MDLLRLECGHVALSLCVVLRPVSVPTQTSADHVQFVGAYSQLKETPGHVYGYQLELWRDGTAVIALWSRADGQQADFPLTQARDVQLNTSTGELRFAAQWCGEDETFRGVIKGRELRGTVTRYGAGQRVATEEVRLLKESDARSDQDRRGWKTLVEQMLNTRGLKC